MKVALKIIIGTWYLLAASVAFGQGISIPAGARISVDAGTLNVSGDITIATTGILSTSTGTVKLSGNWANSGTYTPTTGTLEFTKTAGTQTLDSGGIVAGKLFYNLTHSGTGTLQFINNTLNIDNNFTNSAGTVDANGRAMTVAETWSNSGTFTANANTVTLDGTTQTISGSTTFYNLSKTVAAADTLIFQAGTTQTVSNSITLQGAVGQLLALNSDDDDATPTQAAITLSPGGVQSFQYLNVKNSNASGGVTLIAGTTSTNSGNNNNWVFGGGTTFTWDGSSSTDWDTAANWDLGAVPGSSDSVVIPSTTIAPTQPSLAAIAAAGVTVASLTLNDATSALTLAGKDITVTGTLSNLGTIRLVGSETTVSFGTIDADSGTFMYVGDADNISETYTIKDFGAAAGTDYFNITIADTGGEDTYQTAAGTTLTMAGALTATTGILDISTNSNTVTTVGAFTVNGATVTATNSTVTVGGAFTVSSGTFTAPTGTLSVAGNFNHSGGTFTHSSGTVSLNGTNQSVLGTSTFNNLTKTVTTARTLTFDSAGIQTIAATGTLTLQGASGQLLSIRSTTSGTKAGISLQPGGIQAISYVDVQDSDASLAGGLRLIARNSTSLVNTTNWSLTGDFVWDGSTSTNWDVAANWDLGLVPSSADNAFIPNVANDPILATNVVVTNLTIQAAGGGGDLFLNGKNLQATGTFSNDGTIRLVGNETVTLTQDTDSGIFKYIGNNSATARTILDFGTTDYYNLVIDATGGTPDTFTTTASGTITAANNVNVTTSSLTLGASATLATTGTLTVDGGTLTATNGNIDANGSVVISSGTLTAPSTGTFTVAVNFTHTGGTFTHSSGTVTLDTAAAAVVSGATTFYNLTSNTAGKSISFQHSTTQTVDGTLTLAGTGTSHISIASTLAGTRFTFNFPNGAQTVQFLTVQDSQASTNNVTCFSCTNTSGNDNLEAVPHWIFLTLAISYPQAGKTADTTPTVIGVATASSTIEIRSGSCAGTLYATTTSDTNGNFIVEGTTALAPGSYTLVPCLGGAAGGSVNVTLVSSPTATQQPLISSPANNEHLAGGNPTITGQSQATQTVTVYAYDADGNLLYQSVGSGTSDGSGGFSVAVTTELFKGTNYLTVVVDGVASNIITVSFVDPFGIIFDSISNLPIKDAIITLYKSNGSLAVPGVDIVSTDVNPVTTGADGFYSFIATAGNYYYTVSAAGYDFPSVQTTFPGGRTITTGSKAETFTVATRILHIDVPMDPNGLLLRLVKDANKSEVHIGEVVTYSITIENPTSNDIRDVLIQDKIPPGFKFLDGRVTLDGGPIDNPQNGRPLVFDVGIIPAGVTKTLKYQLVVGSGVDHGNYDNVAYARYANGQRLSNNTTKTVKVVLDPLFDMGTAIGKVFFDRNENGIQDAPEYDGMDREMIVENPVSNVQIVMEDGTVVTTDKNGQFNIPGLTPGRHLLRLDERSLPQGSYLTTDKVVIVDVTQGGLVKVNFGVNLDYNRKLSNDEVFFNEKVKLTQDKNKPHPRLNASMFNDRLVVYNNYIVDKAEIRLFANYVSFIERWRLQIIDKLTTLPVRTFQGDRFSFSDPILWDGKDDQGKQVRLDRDYTYVLRVYGPNDIFDETNPKKISLRTIETDKEYDEYLENKKDEVKSKDIWFRAQNYENNLHTQAIYVDGETVLIDRLNTNVQKVRVLKDKETVAELPVYAAPSLTARDVLEGEEEESNQLIDIILPRGEYNVVLQEGSSQPIEEVKDGTSALAGTVQETEQAPIKTGTYSKPIKVGEDYLFFVAMGDAQMGYNFADGNIEPIQSSDRYKEGFWSQGKLAYYLKGKIKGKYLVTSSFVSDRERKDLFSSLSADDYYPVYGDQSSTNKQAANTEGNLYLLVQWDKSSATWGNYNVEFNDTEFSKYNRSLYGGKVDYQSLASTQYGQPTSRVIVFEASAKKRSAHVEYLATGGSLYFLKHKDVIEGTDKIKVQVRDSITGLVVGEKEFKEGADYELNYENGRVLFWLPVPILVASYSIVSDDVLNGNPVYVIADYQYEVKDKLDEPTYGARIKKTFTDNVELGGTYVKESQDNNNYQLKGTDLTVHVGEDATVVAEYAKTESASGGTFASTDGGLSFFDVGNRNTDQGLAYGIRGDARLFNRLGVAAYFKWIGSDFSTPDTNAQQGKELKGISLGYDLNDTTSITLQQDIQKLIDDGGNLQPQAQVGAYQTITTLAQVVHEIRKLKLTGEYRRQEVQEKKDQYETETNQETDSVAVQADYEVNDKLTLTAKEQVNLRNKKDYLTTIGATVSPTEDLTVKVAQTISHTGATNASTIEVSKDVNDQLTLSGSYGLTTDQKGQQANVGALGAKAKVDEDTDIQTALSVAETINGVQSTTMAFGGSSQVDEKTRNETQIAISESQGSRTTDFTFGTKKKLSDDLQLSSSRTFGIAQDQQSSSSSYGLIREKNGRKLEGTLTRKYLEDKSQVSQTNIFGLSGDVNDNWALVGSLERGEVQNLNGGKSDRSVLSTGAGYVKKDPETGEQTLKGSSKLELRLDDGNQDTRQFLIYNALEGKINSEWSALMKMEYSETKNTTLESTVAKHKEMVLGASYRPIYFDKLNMLGRYTYLEGRTASEQVDNADVEDQRAHVFAMDGIYDVDDKWQVVEKFAYRIAEEKVTGFDFTKTHTWLMIHRLNYKLDQNWVMGGEYRMLTQEEAEDTKYGFLLELAYRLSENGQLGIGYNFTQFSDDLTDLGYITQGPFVRMTGTVYDQTEDEKKRMKAKLLEEKITYWAWAMVNDELSNPKSNIMEELNQYYHLAKDAAAAGRVEEAHQIYKDIIIAGDMMLQEAREYIHSQVNKEERLKKMNDEADEYFKNGDYEKARKIWEKILEEAQRPMLE